MIQLRAISGCRWRLRAACAGIALALAIGVSLSSAAAAGAARECSRAAFRVILDVGHTRQSPGAISARGEYEYDFNLKLAQRIEARLVEAGFAKTALLVTAGKKRDSLIQRVLRANATSADLLISIHHDSVPEQFKETWDMDGQPQRYSDRFRGHSIFVSYDNGASRKSLRFARLLGHALGEAGLQYTPHYKEPFMGRFRRALVDKIAGVYRYDELIVLRATRMPAVLLEAGSIVNRDEEVTMATPERRALIAGAVLEAVQRFCAGQAPPS